EVRAPQPVERIALQHSDRLRELGGPAVDRHASHLDFLEDVLSGNEMRRAEQQHRRRTSGELVDHDVLPCILEIDGERRARARGARGDDGENQRKAGGPRAAGASRRGAGSARRRAGETTAGASTACGGASCGTAAASVPPMLRQILQGSASECAAASSGCVSATSSAASSSTAKVKLRTRRAAFGVIGNGARNRADATKLARRLAVVHLAASRTERAAPTG